VLFGDRRPAGGGNYVPFVLGSTFWPGSPMWGAASGYCCVAAGARGWRWRSSPAPGWCSRLRGHILIGRAYEMRTVVAMTLRTTCGALLH